MEKQRLSRAEIQKNYRLRKKAENLEAYLQKERDRGHDRRRNNKVKVVTDLTDREHRRLKKDWRDRQRRSRLCRKNAEAYSPATSTDGRDCLRQRGRKKKRRAEARSYRTITKLRNSLVAVKRAKDRYRKKLERLQKPKTPTGLQNEETPEKNTPRTKTRKILKNCTVSTPVRKTLIFHNVLIDEMQNSRKGTTTEKHRRLSLKFIEGKVLKNSRVCRLARNAGIALPKCMSSPKNSRLDKVDEEAAGHIGLRGIEGCQHF